ncbi:membrane lipoprotein [Vibrio phage 1.081.O._10N.286.52.C2]|nr:membrane lipoprotein [Vibrio phage 1.081.O._10N.286.52.C2]
MKKILCAIVAVLSLSACDPTTIETTDNMKVLAIRDTLNATEKKMLNRFIVETSTPAHYNELYSALARRNIYGNDSTNIRPDSELPFCDVIEELLISEEGLRSTYAHTLTNQWREQYGYTLAQSCDYTPNVSEKLTDEVTEPSDTNVELLAPEEYDKLIAAASNCERAKLKLIELTSSGRPLTVQDGNDTTRLVIGCKMYLLERELQK